jgi:hypothetical protein
MIKYFKGEACPPIVGAKAKFKFKLEGEDSSEIDGSAMTTAEEFSINHIESYCNPQKEEEESGVEFEYDWWHAEISEDQYNKLSDEFEEIEI